MLSATWQRSHARTFSTPSAHGPASSVKHDGQRMRPGREADAIILVFVYSAGDFAFRCLSFARCTLAGRGRTIKQTPQQDANPMNWFYESNAEQKGPVPEDEL